MATLLDGAISSATTSTGTTAARCGRRPFRGDRQRVGAASARRNVADVATSRGRYRDAYPTCRHRAVSGLLAAGASGVTSGLRRRLGYLHALEGHDDEADRWHATAVGAAEQQHQVPVLALVHNLRSLVLRRRGQSHQAQRGPSPRPGPLPRARHSGRPRDHARVARLHRRIRAAMPTRRSAYTARASNRRVRPATGAGRRWRSRAWPAHCRCAGTTQRRVACSVRPRHCATNWWSAAACRACRRGPGDRRVGNRSVFEASATLGAGEPDAVVARYADDVSRRTAR